jgi:hypothetical protein
MSGDYESFLDEKKEDKAEKRAPVKNRTHGDRKVSSESADEQPANLSDGEPVDDTKQADDDDDDDYASNNSEDDPEKLWCICQQPHNNRFMICCDQCLDWYHGKCVGITKKMGKDMEATGNDWRCPKCKEGAQLAIEEKQKQSLALKLKEREEFRKKQLELSVQHKSSGDLKNQQLGPSPKRSDTSKSVVEKSDQEKVCAFLYNPISPYLSLT